MPIKNEQFLTIKKSHDLKLTNIGFTKENTRKCQKLHLTTFTY